MIKVRHFVSSVTGHFQPQGLPEICFHSVKFPKNGTFLVGERWRRTYFGNIPYVKVALVTLRFCDIVAPKMAFLKICIFLTRLHRVYQRVKIKKVSTKHFGFTICLKPGKWKFYSALLNRCTLSWYLEPAHHTMFYKIQ